VLAKKGKERGKAPVLQRKPRLMYKQKPRKAVVRVLALIATTSRAF